MLVCGDNIQPERSFFSLSFDGTWPEAICRTYALGMYGAVRQRLGRHETAVDWPRERGAHKDNPRADGRTLARGHPPSRFTRPSFCTRRAAQLPGRRGEGVAPRRRRKRPDSRRSTTRRHETCSGDCEGRPSLRGTPHNEQAEVHRRDQPARRASVDHIRKGGPR